MRVQLWITVAVLLALAVVGCKREEPAATQASAPAGTLGAAAWPIDGLEFVKGGPVQIEPEEVTVVEFWATWCPPCRATIAHLTEIAHRYKDRKVVVVGVSNEPANVVEPFVEQMGEKIDYNVAVDRAGEVGRGYMRAFAQDTIPHAFVVDTAGKVVWHGHPMDRIEQALDRALSGRPGSIASAEPKATRLVERRVNM